ncbi:MAG: ABC transporter ATP-binding protein [Verrucomicrobiota bacterium]|nr:ABC transporter ATP-binding protein [Verrucomicrobiota bacterium]
MPLLQATHLKKAFHSPQHVEVLSDVSLTVYAGESIAITGRSGEGKTTLLHILGTLEPFDSGELLLHGKPFDPTEAPHLRNQHIGFIFQAFNLLEDFTTLENVLMPARIARKPISRSRGLELLSLVGLESRADFPVKLLSGGERQRAAIARALCNDPELLFADEPSGNLDRATADAIGNLLFDLVRTQHKTLLLVTHDPELSARCTAKYVLSRGNLLNGS